MTEELSRTSALASRHAALGSGLEDWNGMGTAWTYDTDPNDEHDAVRERAGMFDMSPLKKVFVRGPDAQAVLDHLTTRDMSKIAPGKAAYLCVLTERGGIADDAIVSSNGGGEWMIVHGSGDTMALLEASADGRDATLEFTDDLHDLSVQGPSALDILNGHCDIDLAALAYFEHAPASLFGHACRISRTGYSGERGYEIFADGTSWSGVLRLRHDRGQHSVGGRSRLHGQQDQRRFPRERGGHGREGQREDQKRLFGHKSLRHGGRRRNLVVER